jgi:hypothetical protein
MLEQCGTQSPDLNAEDLLVFACVRNEISRLPFFLRYYRSKCADKFFIVDNESSDGTRRYLLDQNDVVLFRTDESYASSNCGANWIEFLLNKYGMGRWCLLVDADEIFIYPHFEFSTIKQLCWFLEKEGKNGVSSTMVDMYENGFPSLENNNGKELWDIFSYFDENCAGSFYSQMPADGKATIFFGGVRKRVFNAFVCLHKTPLIKYTGIQKLISSTHRISHVEYSPLVECALLHFKYDFSFSSRVHEESEREEHWANAKEYKQYEECLNSNPALTLYSDTYSVKYDGSQQLVNMNLMKSSQEFSQFLKTYQNNVHLFRNIE